MVVEDTVVNNVVGNMAVKVGWKVKMCDEDTVEKNEKVKLG